MSRCSLKNSGRITVFSRIFLAAYVYFGTAAQVYAHDFKFESGETYDVTFIDNRKLYSVTIISVKNDTVIVRLTGVREQFPVKMTSILRASLASTEKIGKAYERIPGRRRSRHALMAFADAPYGFGGFAGFDAKIPAVGVAILWQFSVLQKLLNSQALQTEISHIHIGNLLQTVQSATVSLALRCGISHNNWEVFAAPGLGVSVLQLDAPDDSLITYTLLGRFEMGIGRSITEHIFLSVSGQAQYWQDNVTPYYTIAARFGVGYAL